MSGEADPGGIKFRRRRAFGPVTDPKRSPDFEVRAMVAEWWRQRDSTASIPGFQSALEVPEREDDTSPVENTP